MNWHELERKSYLVGGAVRDELLGIPVHEKDYVVVGVVAEDLLSLGFRPVGNSFPVFLHPKTYEEYALARIERKVGQGYHGFNCFSSPSVSLEEDLKRRDLTINAMAKTSHGVLIDPYQGKEDIHNRFLRHVSSSFIEDPVRILRVARFASRFNHLGFRIHPDTWQLMKNMVQNSETKSLIAERIWKEYLKAIQEPCPHIFIQVLKQCGALKDTFPEFDQLFNQPSFSHPSLGDEALFVLKESVGYTADPCMRFALFASHVQYIDTMNHWKITKKYVDITQILIQCMPFLNQNIHKCIYTPTNDLLKQLKIIDIFRRPERAIYALKTLNIYAKIRNQFPNLWIQLVEFLCQYQPNLVHIEPRQRLYQRVDLGKKIFIKTYKNNKNA